eukprot:TRINITY_DN2259_c0_g1_i3.p1 TRINITY_DN2259_c0_g1~~TRINITY_DN2259_c0_g1_i3.p1  ORF type:complete len:625 (+),score=199.65 TRINITY_DN2259_c0_g1_i3:60-1934(+)
MRLPLLAAAAAALLCGAAHGREAVALTADDFIAKVGTDAVWVVGFGLDADCPEMAKALAVQAEAEWLQVGWVDVAASPAARVLADVHQVGAYPGLVVVSPTGAVPLKALADVTLKNAVEKWLPPMVWDARRRGLVHTLPNAEDAESGEEDDDAADGFCTLYTTDIEDARSMAGLRAAALKFAGVLKQRVVVAEDAERSGTWVECTGREPGVEADSTPGYAAVVDYLAGLSDLAWTDADAAAFLAAARAAAAENEGESLVPKVSSFARWAALRNRARAIAPQAPLDAQVSILFLLDSKGKQFDAHFAEAAAFAKAGGGKIGRQIPVTVGWVDTAVEGEKLLRRFFEKPGDKAPHVAFVVPVQQNKQQPGQAPPPDGMMRGVMKSQKFDDFKADLILKFFETKLMSDGRIMPFDDDEQLANAVWSSKDVAVGPAEPEGEPWFLTVAGGADGKDKTNKEKKAAKAKKDKKKKKKKGDKKLTKKEEVWHRKERFFFREKRTRRGRGRAAVAEAPGDGGAGRGRPRGKPRVPRAGGDARPRARPHAGRLRRLRVAAGRAAGGEVPAAARGGGGEEEGPGGEPDDPLSRDRTSAVPRGAGGAPPPGARGQQTPRARGARAPGHVARRAVG